MEKFEIITHPKDRFKVHDILDKSGHGYGRFDWDGFIVDENQLDLLNENNVNITAIRLNTIMKIE